MFNKWTIRQIEASDSKLIKDLMDTHWGGEPLIIRGKKYFPSFLDGLLVFRRKKVIGFLIYEILENTMEIVVFEVFEKFKGIGSKLLEELKQIAIKKHCEKILVMTTNDNLDALRFYQKKGFCISKIHIDSIKESRKIKPAISDIGDYGIALRDEIDLEYFL